jgi:hypothetical protein
MKEEEIKAIEEQDVLAEKEYWTNVDYEEAVNNEIRKKYSVSQEFAILRQKEEKLEEYQEYYNYCEECKAYVKSKKEVGG